MEIRISSRIGNSFFDTAGFRFASSYNTFAGRSKKEKNIMIEDQITETPIIEDPITQLDLLSAVLFSIVANCMILAIVLLILFY